MEKNKFKFKYSPLVICLIVLVALIGAGGIALNVVNVVRGFAPAVKTAKIITTILSSVLDVALVFIALSVLFFGYYKVTDTHIVCRFGVFRTKYKIDEVAEFAEFKKSGKLVMYLSEKKFTVIVIDRSEYSAFLSAVRAKNPTMSIELLDEDKENKD